MRKKLLTIFLTILFVCVTSMTFIACGNNNGGNNDDRNPDIVAVYNTYVAYAEENGKTPLSYEDWLASIKGEKGDKGDTGADGQDGVTPTIEISNDGYWVINGVKTE